MQRASSDPVIKFFISVIGIVVIAITLKELSHIFLPFVIAYFLFFAFSPLNNFLARKKVPSFAVIILDLTVIVLLLSGISSFIIDSFMRLGAELPVYFAKLNTLVHDAAISAGINDASLKNFDIQKMIASIDYKIVAGDIFSSTFPLMGSILFVIFFYVFIVTGHSGIYKSFKKRYVSSNVVTEITTGREPVEEGAVPREVPPADIHQTETLLSTTFNTITEQIQRYILAKVLVNLSAGIAVTVVLYLMGVDFPIVWGLFVFLFNFIPTIGSAMALILPSLMALIQFQSVGFGLLTAAILGVVQTLFFNLLEPMIIGKRLNLNPLLILFSLLIWGYIWGIIGMLLSVPLTAILKIAISTSKSKNLVFLNDLMSQETGKDGPIVAP